MEDLVTFTEQILNGKTSFFVQYLIITSDSAVLNYDNKSISNRVWKGSCILDNPIVV